MLLIWEKKYQDSLKMLKKLTRLDRTGYLKKIPESVPGL